MSAPCVQLVISQLQPQASRELFVELHRQTDQWMREHPDCLHYEVYEGENGEVADRMVWRTREGSGLAGQSGIFRAAIGGRHENHYSTLHSFLRFPNRFRKHQ